MRILGIETSCDETAAAVVEDGTKVLSNIIASQIPLHQKTGGVVPEVAAREHVLKISPVIEEALTCANLGLGGAKSADGRPPRVTSKPGKSQSKSGMASTSFSPSLFANIDAIAVTRGPGLLSSLVIGTTAASTLATYLKKPLIPVNHIAGHIYANWLDESPEDPITFPILVLTVSGGHNELVLMKSHAEYTLIGETLDDAAGEAFDKVARLIGLGYPGGPLISKAAEGVLPTHQVNDTASASLTPPAPRAPHAATPLVLRNFSEEGVPGNPDRYPLPKAHINKKSYDFSFSGLKTAVLNLVMSEHKEHGTLSQRFIIDCAASFQNAVCQILSDKLLRAAEEYGVKEVHLAGGVSANTYLRKIVQQKITGQYYNDHLGRKQKLTIANSLRLRYPQKFPYCTDNAAMIAAAAFFHYHKNPKSYLSPYPLLADPGISLY